MLERTTVAGLLRALAPADLTPLQLGVLYAVAAGEGRPVSRDTIAQSVWGGAREPDKSHNAITVTIMRLRKRGYNIKTRYGLGYSLHRSAA